MKKFLTMPVNILLGIALVACLILSKPSFFAHGQEDPQPVFTSDAPQIVAPKYDVFSQRVDALVASSTSLSVADAELAVLQKDDSIAIVRHLDLILVELKKLNAKSQ